MSSSPPSDRNSSAGRVRTRTPHRCRSARHRLACPTRRLRPTGDRDEPGRSSRSPNSARSWPARSPHSEADDACSCPSGSPAPKSIYSGIWQNFLSTTPGDPCTYRQPAPEEALTHLPLYGRGRFAVAGRRLARRLLRRGGATVSTAEYGCSRSGGAEPVVGGLCGVRRGVWGEVVALQGEGVRGRPVLA